MGKTNPSQVARERRKVSIRKRVSGTVERPRLTVFRSASHIYAQVVNDESGHTLVAAPRGEGGRRERHQGRFRPKRLSLSRSRQGARRRCS